MSFAIIVDFRLRPGAHPAFRRLVDDNARVSVRDEPGCRRFDVLDPHGEPDRVLLYEIYDDAAAFDHHLATAHFKSFDADSAPLIEQKTVIRCALAVAG